MAHQEDEQRCDEEAGRDRDRSGLLLVQLIRGGRQVDVRRDPGEEFDRAGVREHLSKALVR